MTGEQALALVDAGAIVTSQLDPDSVGDSAGTTDTITARRYRHHAIEDDVVRLVPQSLGEAEDLALAFLDLRLVDQQPVGMGRRRAIGFPAWPVVNDPANGHYALALAKDMARLARLARTKPGLARTSAEELAEPLARAAPHFLPTFFEEIGRAFLAADNAKLAGAMFGRAREAERVHALEVDEERVRDVLLEFEFAGALTAKTLADHAKDLSARQKPDLAYQGFLQVCSERVAGGLVPQAGLASVLRRLAKRAGLNLDQEDERVIGALVQMPAVVNAPADFWLAYTPALTRLAKADRDVRALLLDLWPAESDAELEQAWCIMLTDSGAVAGLTDVDPDDETRHLETQDDRNALGNAGPGRPRLGPAAWLARAGTELLTARRSYATVWLMDLVPAMEPRLRAEGRPVRITDQHHYVDADLLDLCLSLDLPLDLPPQLQLDLGIWLARGGPARRDLAALAAAENIRGTVDSAFDNMMSNAGRWWGASAPVTAEVLDSRAGAHKMLERWLERQADQARAASLPQLVAILDGLAPVAAQDLLRISPSAQALLCTLDPQQARDRTPQDSQDSPGTTDTTAGELDSLLLDCEQKIKALSRPAEVVDPPADQIEAQAAARPAGPKSNTLASFQECELRLTALLGLTDYEIPYDSPPGLSGSTAELRQIVDALTADRPAGGATEFQALDFYPGVAWPSTVGRLGAVALRVACQATPAEERAVLVELLAALGPTPLAEPDGQWRVVKVDYRGRGKPHPGTVVVTGGGLAMVFCPDRGFLVNLLEHVPGGGFGDVPGYQVVSSRASGGWGGRDRIERLIARVQADGPAPWWAAAVSTLVQATGMPKAQAALLLAGLPRGDSEAANFLDPHTRKVLGVKAADVKVAQAALQRIGRDWRISLLNTAMPDDPDQLWDHGPNVEALAARWVEAFGRQTVIPDELVTELDRVLNEDWGWGAATLLRGLTDPGTCSWLTRDQKWQIRSDGRDLLGSGDGSEFSHDTLLEVVRSLVWLGYRLPQNDPLREPLATVPGLLRYRLANPDLLVPYLHDQPLDGALILAGRSPVIDPGLARFSQFPLGTIGSVFVTTTDPLAYIYPARLSGPKDPMLVRTTSTDRTVEALKLVLTEGELERILASAPSTNSASSPIWAQDPLVSAPELVPLVGQKLGLDASAARLYLQLLTLPDPSDAQVIRWNGWSPRQLKTATAALRAAGVVVDGKRSRAGRSVFLPCPWLDARTPIEAWKVELLGLNPDGESNLGVTVPLRGLPELFRRAWQRVQDGDGPRMDTLPALP